MCWKIIQKRFFSSVSKTSGNAWKIGHITHHLGNNQVSETPWHMLSHCEIAKLLVFWYCHSGIDAHHQHWIVFLKQFFFSFFDAKNYYFSSSISMQSASDAGTSLSCHRVVCWVIVFPHVSTSTDNFLWLGWKGGALLKVCICSSII
jgi:hypothetical protein